jgi:DNA modification methylase
MYLNKIINDDGLKIVKKLKNNSIDLICIDPPYNIGKINGIQLMIIMCG